jgi:hypothetical protein
MLSTWSTSTFDVIYQLTWKILPGLGGMSCSEFSARLTPAPNHEQGVAFDCANDAERDALLRDLEEHFSQQRFSTSASAFEAVKSFVLERGAKQI